MHSARGWTSRHVATSITLLLGSIAISACAVRAGAPRAPLVMMHPRQAPWDDGRPAQVVVIANSRAERERPTLASLRLALSDAVNASGVFGARVGAREAEPYRIEVSLLSWPLRESAQVEGATGRQPWTATIRVIDQSRHLVIMSFIAETPARESDADDIRRLARLIVEGLTRADTASPNANAVTR